MLPLQIQSLGELFSFSLILKFTLVALINTIFMCIVSLKFFQAVQQCGYKGAEYYKWIFAKENSKLTRLAMLSLLSVLGFMLTNMAFAFITNPIAHYLGFIWYFVFFTIYIVGEKKKKSKVPMVMTRRMIRLMATFVVITIIFNLLIIYGVNLLALLAKDALIMNFRYAIICLCPIVVPYLILLAYLINNPYEKYSSNKHLQKATQILDDFKGIKIAITGSYAKTSCKEILATILSEKYSVLATPKSFNTPLGISKTAKRLNDNYNVFIAEMGARHNGDIKQLCQIVKPNIGVITGITSQHLETFFSINNIKKAKYELVESIGEGHMVFSSDNTHTVEMYNSCKSSKNLAGLTIENNPLVYAENIEYSLQGTTFTLCYKDEKIKCSTKLVGENACHNIVLAVAVATKLGLTLTEIAVGISKIEQVKHRLEVIKNEVGAYIIDDSYNSNPEGVKRAIEVLKLVKGKKYVVTPGMIELGIFENQENYNFGKQLASVADKVLLIKRGGTLSIREGLLSQGYDKNNIIMIKSLEESKKFLQENLKSDDGVLFENDLPDLYNE